MAHAGEKRTCRFCGLGIDDDDVAADVTYHDTCAEPPHDGDDGPKESPTHPMYGKRPAPLVQPG